MSKAFTKESDGGLDDDEGGEGADSSSIGRGAGSATQGSKNYITPAGAERLKAELKQLLHVERPSVVKTVSWAASNGDRSENGDYIYGKRRLRQIDGRIRFLTKRLDAAEIVDPTAQKSDRVLFGATVTVADEDGKPRTYCIVGIDEIDARRGHVSWVSPVARALLNAKVGDVVTLHTPKGEEELEITAIRYVELASR